MRLLSVCWMSRSKPSIRITTCPRIRRIRRILGICRLLFMRRIARDLTVGTLCLCLWEGMTSRPSLIFFWS